MSILEGKQPNTIASPAMPVTAEMWTAVTAMVSAEMDMQSSEVKKLQPTDAVVRLVYIEMSHPEDAQYPVSNRELAWLVFWNCNEVTISEYIALKPWHASIVDFEVAKDLVRGIHCPTRNKLPLNANDPESLERNVALLKSALYVHEEEGSWIEYGLCLDGEWMGRGFLDNKLMGRGPLVTDCSDLIIDYPQYCITLMKTIEERGYDAGIDVFRDMITISSPALMEGAL